MGYSVSKKRAAEGDISRCYSGLSNKEDSRVSYEVLQRVPGHSNQIISESSQPFAASIHLAAPVGDNALHTTQPRQKHKAADVCPSSCHVKCDVESVASCEEDLSSAAMKLHSVLSPSMVKGMIKPRVNGSWLDLNSSFCARHLPPEDTVMTLEDEFGECHRAMYVANRTQLSSGWKEFSMSHNLSAGDILIFHLVDPTKFKVYIFRSNHGEVEGARTGETIPGLSKEATDNWDSSSAGSSNNIERPELDPPWISFRESRLNLSKNGPTFIEHESDSRQSFQGPYGPIRDFTSFKDQFLKDRVSGRYPPAAKIGEDCLLEDYYKLCMAEGCFLHRDVNRNQGQALIDSIIIDIIHQFWKLKGIKLVDYDLVGCGFKDLENIKSILEDFENLGYSVSFMIKFIDRMLSYKDEEDRIWLEANLKEDIACFKECCGEHEDDDSQGTQMRQSCCKLHDEFQGRAYSAVFWTPS